MAIITIRKELQDFLEKEGVLESFIENAKEYATRFNIEGERYIDDVMYAFMWEHTKRGYRYWSKICGKWYTYRIENEIV